MATGTNAERIGKKWQFYECSLVLNTCLKSTTQWKAPKLKKAVADNDFEQVMAVFQDGGKPNLNKLLTFRCTGCTLHIPPLCVAVFFRNLPIINCLLKNGADPNRVGQMQIEGHENCFSRVGQVNPLLLALEDHPSEGLPFDPAVASTLLVAGADINTQVGSKIREEEEEGGSLDYDFGKTPLLCCVNVWRPLRKAVFHFLLDNGADLLIKDSHGKTALQNALEFLVDNPNEVCEMALFADELIRRCGFTYGRDRNNGSEFKLVLDSMKSAVLSNQSTLKTQQRAHLLLDAGYKCSEVDVANFEEMGVQNVDHSLAQRVYGTYLHDLKHLCRLLIRKVFVQFKCPCGPEKLSRLLLPKSLLNYLTLKPSTLKCDR